MTTDVFKTSEGIRIPAVTPETMKRVDNLAVQRFEMDILQMMENAGRHLTEMVMDMTARATIAVVAGNGGNGGGGLCCARHLINAGYEVKLILDRNSNALKGPVRKQYAVLQTAGCFALDTTNLSDALDASDLIVDALIGYGLHGIPMGRTSELIVLCNQSATPVLSLDVPSGLNAETGMILGAAIQPERTMTLALPKTGIAQGAGDLYLADIGIPKKLYEEMDIAFEWPFGNAFITRIFPCET